MRKSAYSTLFSKALAGSGQLTLALALLASILFSAFNPEPALAVGSLTIEPLTWNVIGLDSNNVSVGPNLFPIGARVCNTSGSASNITVTFDFNDAADNYTGDTYINLRGGTEDSLTFTAVPGGTGSTGAHCRDAYFEVAVTRNSAAYTNKRGYTITASDGSVSASTPSNRELYVEYLISQSRNAVTNMELSSDGSNYSSIAAGGTMTLAVGSTYWIRLSASTATNGYEQLETFISIPNTIFQVLGVSTTYTADTSSRVTSPDDKLYANGCYWINNTTDLNYRSCLETGKAGGNIQVIYQVKILSVPGAPLVNPQPLSTLVYDFSGSSYHYNADFSTSTRFAKIVGPTLAKSFSPKTILTGSTSVLTFTINNPGTSTLNNINFVDILPSGLNFNSSTPTITYNVSGSSCGASPSGVVSNSNQTITFSNITVPGSGTCIISVSAVASSTTAFYTNTTENLFVDTLDTGSKGSDTLEVVSIPPVTPVNSCPSPVTLATWAFESDTLGSNNGAFAGTIPGTINASNATAFPNLGSNRTSAICTTASCVLPGDPSGTVAPITGNGQSWGIGGNIVQDGVWPLQTVVPDGTTIPSFQFQINASRYGGLRISANANMEGAWTNGDQWYILSSTDGTTWSSAGLGDWTNAGFGNAWGTIASTTTVNAASTTYFRVIFTGAPDNKHDSTIFLDNVTISGCPPPNPPTLSKAFSPASIPTSPSTLTFTIGNPNSSILTGVNFTDTLPTGLVIYTPNGLTGPTCSTGSMTGQTISAAAGTSIISLSGATLAANSSCTFSVNVTGNVPGLYRNITSNISSTETGQNTTSSGYGVSDLTVTAVPPVIAKNFGASSVLTNGTTTLTFGIYNPNTGTTLNGVAFTDTLPAGLVVATPNGISGSCDGGTITATAGTSTISLSGASLTALSSCTFSVNVTGTTTGQKDNSVTVTSTTAGTGNTATASILVRNQVASIKLTKQIGLTSNLSGAWYSSLNVAVGTSVYYRFVVENTGDVDFTSFSVADPTLQALGWGNPISCTWYQANLNLAPPDYVTLSGATLSVAGIADPVAYCVVGPVTAQSGTNTNTATVTGESSLGQRTSTDSVSYQGGTTTTPVTLSYFSVVRRGANVYFEWSTLTETGNVGFNLYAESPTGLVQVNHDLIASKGIDSLERQDYVFDAKISSDTFYIEDVSLHGETMRYGPFLIGEVYGERLEVEQVDQFAIEDEVAQDAKLRQSALRKGLVVPAAARKNPITSQRGFQLVNTINLQVNQTGIQRVTYEMLYEAGLNLSGVPANKITLINKGQMIPIFVSRGRFGPGSYIEFYGESLDTIYTDTNIYTVQVNAGVADRVGTVNPPINRRAVPVGSYVETLMVNKQRMYSPSAPGDDPWFDTSMIVYRSPKTWDFSFEVDNLVKNMPARISVTLWGMIDLPQDPDHHVVLGVNGTRIADVRFDGIREYEILADIPASVLREGLNVLQVTLMGDLGTPYDMVFMDKFDVSYERILVARDGHLTFTAVGEAFTVGNLPSRDLVVYRLDAAGPVRLGGLKVAASGKDSYLVTFPGLTQGPATYLVAASQSQIQPGLVPIRTVANLSQPAEFLIISHPHFIDGLAPLVATRRAEGLTVSVVNVDDLYAQYTAGIFDPRAIQDHIRYAAKNLGTRYILLVGGDTRDYRGYEGSGSISFIPSLYARTSRDVSFAPVDPLFTDLDGDSLPDLAIGRFPVRTQAELAMMVQKTLGFKGKDYGQTALFISDKKDSKVSFQGISNSMEQRMPSGWVTEGVHLDDLDVATARQNIVQTMNRGIALVTFTGHSGPTNWSFENLFTTAHASQLTNSGRPFVLVQWGCWNTYYVNPTRMNLAQSFLFSGENGAAAVLGAVTITDANSELMLGELFTPNMVQPGIRIGDALQESKIELSLARPELLDVLLGWSLMGDPTLVIEQ